MSEEKKKIRRRVVVPRELLLVEVERHCRDALCRARSAVALTKDEARAYTSFTCERCERTWPDALTERDVPEWWEELQIRSLEGRQALRTRDSETTTEGPIERMSDAWRLEAHHAGDKDANGEEDAS